MAKECPPDNWTRGDAYINADNEEKREVLEMHKNYYGWQKFEGSVTYHPAPGCSESDGVEAELVWQMYDNNEGWEEWIYSSDPDRDRNNGYITRQIWRLVPSQKVEVKEVDNWVRVEEKYPQSDGRYLCYYTTRQDKTPHISILSWRKILGFNGQFIVTHWQPLPKAPTH